MFYLACFILIFTSLQLLIALSNLVFRSRLHKYIESGEEFLSVLIPARNEEENIAEILHDIIAQSFQHLEIIVFDDDSDDSTANIVNDFMSRDNRIKLIHSKELPEGWLGKNYACHSLARAAKGDYLLFIDADVRIGGNLLNNVIAYARHRKLGLLSIFPSQTMITQGERTTVPVMNYILLTLLPLFLVQRSGFVSLSAANGQFMLFNSQLYKKYEPHLKVKNRKAEDIAISRFYKKQKIAVACLTGNADITCRMYKGFTEAVNGFSKNVIAFFGNSYLLSILFWLVTSVGFIAILLGLQLHFLIIYLAVYFSTRVVVSVVSRQPVGDNLLWLFHQQWAMGLFIFGAFKNTINKDYQWKGRSIS